MDRSHREYQTGRSYVLRTLDRHLYTGRKPDHSWGETRTRCHIPNMSRRGRTGSRRVLEFLSLYCKDPPDKTHGPERTLLPHSSTCPNPRLPLVPNPLRPISSQVPGRLPLPDRPLGSSTRSTVSGVLLHKGSCSTGYCTERLKVPPLTSAGTEVGPPQTSPLKSRSEPAQGDFRDRTLLLPTASAGGKQTRRYSLDRSSETGNSGGQVEGHERIRKSFTEVRTTPCTQAPYPSPDDSTRVRFPEVPRRTT